MIMKKENRMVAAASVCASTLILNCAPAQDWPQWRGPNRDAQAAGFAAPKTWPKELTQKWKVAVGEGVSTPCLVGDKLYLVARQAGAEVTRCLEAVTGKELWQDKYESGGATGPASGFSGPRSSPAVVRSRALSHSCTARSVKSSAATSATERSYSITKKSARKCSAR